MRIRSTTVTVALAVAMALPAAGCASISAVSAASSTSGVVAAVGAENQYANVIAQIGGRYVSVTAVQSNPGTDPHTFEASASVAAAISSAQLIVQNGLGYDSFMNKIEAGSPDSARRVIDVQKLLGLPDSTPNPHLWYAPTTMPVVAHAIAAGLSALRPAHAAYFEARLRSFDASLQPWLRAIARFRSAYPGTDVAVTEPVADYLLQAAGTDNLTPLQLQDSVMNGVDPAPQYLALQYSLLRDHRVKVFLYNRQVVDSLTESFLSTARQYHIPVVGVYETMPAPGYDYQTWMLAEVRALGKAVADKVSTQKL